MLSESSSKRSRSRNNPSRSPANELLQRRAAAVSQEYPQWPEDVQINASSEGFSQNDEGQGGVGNRVRSPNSIERPDYFFSGMPESVLSPSGVSDAFSQNRGPSRHHLVLDRPNHVQSPQGNLSGLKIPSFPIHTQLYTPMPEDALGSNPLNYHPIGSPLSPLSFASSKQSQFSHQPHAKKQKTKRTGRRPKVMATNSFSKIEPYFSDFKKNHRPNDEWLVKLYNAQNMVRRAQKLQKQAMKQSRQSTHSSPKSPESQMSSRRTNFVQMNKKTVLQQPRAFHQKFSSRLEARLLHLQQSDEDLRKKVYSSQTTKNNDLIGVQENDGLFKAGYHPLSPPPTRNHFEGTGRDGELDLQNEQGSSKEDLDFGLGSGAKQSNSKAERSEHRQPLKDTLRRSLQNKPNIKRPQPLDPRIQEVIAEYDDQSQPSMPGMLQSVLLRESDNRNTSGFGGLTQLNELSSALLAQPVDAIDAINAMDAMDARLEEEEAKEDGANLDHLEFELKEMEPGFYETSYDNLKKIRKKSPLPRQSREIFDNAIFSFVEEDIDKLIPSQKEIPEQIIYEASNREERSLISILRSSNKTGTTPTVDRIRKQGKISRESLYQVGPIPTRKPGPAYMDQLRKKSRSSIRGGDMDFDNLQVPLPRKGNISEIRRTKNLTHLRRSFASQKHGESDRQLLKSTYETKEDPRLSHAFKEEQSLSGTLQGSAPRSSHLSRASKGSRRSRASRASKHGRPKISLPPSSSKRSLFEMIDQVYAGKQVPKRVEKLQHQFQSLSPKFDKTRQSSFQNLMAEANKRQSQPKQKQPALTPKAAPKKNIMPRGDNSASVEKTTSKAAKTEKYKSRLQVRTDSIERIVIPTDNRPSCSNSHKKSSISSKAVSPVLVAEKEVKEREPSSQSQSFESYIFSQDNTSQFDSSSSEGSGDFEEGEDGAQRGATSAMRKAFTGVGFHNGKKRSGKKHHHRKPYLIYPDNKKKLLWDFWQTIILMYSCLETPYSLVFFDDFNKASRGLNITNFVVDLFFFADIFANFLSAYRDNFNRLIDDPKRIAKRYLTSWFLIDSMSIMPIDVILSESGLNQTLRMTKIGRVARLIKLNKLARVFKLMKEKSNMMWFLQESFTIGIGVQRFIIFLVFLVLFCHMIACMWVFLPKFEEHVEDTWIWPLIDESDSHKYLSAMYLTFSTITTVGYGDISAQTVNEMRFSCLINVFGVLAFSFATGSLSSILQNYDSQNVEYEIKLQYLNMLFKKYDLTQGLYASIKSSFHNHADQDLKEMNILLKELPHKLRQELQYYQYYSVFKRSPYFKTKQKPFLTWMSQNIRQEIRTEDEFIYCEGDTVEGVFFLIRGCLNHVLPKYKNVKYITVADGDVLGTLDIFCHLLNTDQKVIDHWESDKIMRQFTIQAEYQSQVFFLSLMDIGKGKNEFEDSIENLFEDTHTALQNALALKLRTIALCEDQLEKKRERLMSSFKSNQSLEGKFKLDEETFNIRSHPMADLNNSGMLNSENVSIQVSQRKEEESYSFSINNISERNGVSPMVINMDSGGSIYSSELEQSSITSSSGRSSNSMQVREIKKRNLDSSMESSSSSSSSDNSESSNSSGQRQDLKLVSAVSESKPMRQKTLQAMNASKKSLSKSGEMSQQAFKKQATSKKSLKSIKSRQSKEPAFEKHKTFKQLNLLEPEKPQQQAGIVRRFDLQKVQRFKVMKDEENEKTQIVTDKMNLQKIQNFNKRRKSLMKKPQDRIAEKKEGEEFDYDGSKTLVTQLNKISQHMSKASERVETTKQSPAPSSLMLKLSPSKYSSPNVERRSKSAMKSDRMVTPFTMGRRIEPPSSSSTSRRSLLDISGFLAAGKQRRESRRASKILPLRKSVRKSILIDKDHPLSFLDRNKGPSEGAVTPIDQPQTEFSQIDYSKCLLTQPGQNTNESPEKLREDTVTYEISSSMPTHGRAQSQREEGRAFGGIRVNSFNNKFFPKKALFQRTPQGSSQNLQIKPISKQASTASPHTVFSLTNQTPPLTSRVDQSLKQKSYQSSASTSKLPSPPMAPAKVIPVAGFITEEQFNSKVLEMDRQHKIILKEMVEGMRQQMEEKFNRFISKMETRVAAHFQQMQQAQQPAAPNQQLASDPSARTLSRTTSNFFPSTIMSRNVGRVEQEQSSNLQGDTSEVEPAESEGKNIEINLMKMDLEEDIAQPHLESEPRMAINLDLPMVEEEELKEEEDYQHEIRLVTQTPAMMVSQNNLSQIDEEKDFMSSIQSFARENSQFDL